MGRTAPGFGKVPPVRVHRLLRESAVLREPPVPMAPTPPLPSRLAAAAGHVYTATGPVLGLLIVVAAVEGRVVAAMWLGPAGLWGQGTVRRRGTGSRRGGEEWMS